MTLADHDAQLVAEFFDSCSPMMGGYRHSTFAYVAAKTEGGVVLLHGRIRLGIFPHQSVAPPAFETKSVCAGRMALENGYQQGREFVAALLEGTLETCHGKLRLAADDGDRHSAHFVPFHDEGLKSQNRLSVLSISGRRPESYLRQPDLDWELKAAETPYDSLTDLLLEFRLGPHRADATRLEIIADTVAFVHSSSRVKASKASIVLRVAKGLDPNRVTLGYRLLDGHRVVVRGRENGSKFHWHEREGLLHGELTLDASKAPVVHTIANYAEIAQHQCWLSDPSRLPNAHRTAFEAFDDQLALLREAFDNAEGRSYQARDMEAAVAWLLWIHGFQVAHLGGTQKIQVPGPDILAITPHNGDIAIIECTTKHLGSDKKLPDLVANAEKLRRKLDGADQSHRKLLKVLVTTLRADDTAAEREQAARLGVLVVTREDIDDVINRSIAFPNAEKIYAEAFEAARAAQSKYASEPQLSGIMWSEAAR